MGSFNAYPALDIKQPESPLQQAGKVMQLKALQGQIAAQPGQLTLQQQQIETQKLMLDDKAAETSAMKEWAEGQGKIPMTELPNLMLKHGASADAVFKKNQQLMEMDKTATELSTAKRAQAIQTASAIHDAASDVLSLPAALQPAAHEQRQQELIANGIITPDHKIPYDPDTLKVLAAGSAHEKALLEQKDKEATAAASMLNAQARATQANKPPSEITDIADYTKTYLGAKNLPDTPSNQLLARQQYYKDKQPFGAQKIQIEQQRADIATDKAAQEKAAAIEWKPKVTADEKKKAELAENIAENATAVNDTLARRKDLVGAVAGRFTNVEQMIGNNDKDISAIGNRIHNIAMANSGVHGFRSQEGVKDTEATLLNHFKNGPDAVKGALASNVDSVQTFIDNARPESYQTHSKQGGAGTYYQKRGGASSGGPPREAKPGMKWQQNKRTGEYREVPDGG